MAPSNRVAIARPEEAAARGLSACDHCHPPEPKKPSVRSASKS
jgi:hypothetical protein